MLALRSIAILPLAAAALVTAPARAETRHDTQVWQQTVAQGPIKDDLVYFFELQPRFGNDASELSQMMIRGAVGVKLGDKVTVYQGYANVRTRPAGGNETREHRSFQQVNWALGKPGGVALSSRTRLEQRWRNDGSDVGWRLRQMVRYEHALKPDSDAVNALVWAEAFVALNDTDWGARGGFDQLRTFVGTEIGLPGASTLEVGYLNQTIDQPAGRTRMNHAASVTLWFRH